MVYPEADHLRHSICQLQERSTEDNCSSDVQVLTLIAARSCRNPEAHLLVRKVTLCKISARARRGKAKGIPEQLGADV